MVLRLANKSTIVTGAGSGIGRAAATLFAAEGAKVTCADIDGAAASATAEAIGSAAIAVQVDVADEAAAADMVSETLSAFGRVDAVYANAGIGGPGRAGDVTLEDWNRVISINLTGVWLSVKHALAPMIEAGGGSLVLQASIGGVIGVPGIASYAAAKGGVIGLTKQMAVDYGPQNIRVNAICPGTVPTPLVIETYEARGGFASGSSAGPDASIDELLEASTARFPLGRLGTVENIAQLALHLASDESAWTTGATFNIDGGMSAQ
ncbi:MAG: NAD(P)-dependent dehydrogenase (short-subunit alcohol dehydrogenase family) [Ilumatobacter sp.]|jgi:NAD(P)-dependent dehydrogenase (short-subunit alcohol dehydrogenase family)